MLYIQYCEIDDTDTPIERHIKLIIDWMIFYTYETHSMDGIKLEMALKKYLTAKSDNIFIVAKNDWFVWLTVCG